MVDAKEKETEKRTNKQVYVSFIKGIFGKETARILCKF